MTAEINDSEKRIDITPAELADIGEGVVAYLKEMDGEELRGKFPDIPQMAPGTRLWALFAANGRPILLTDQRDSAIAGAMQHDLLPVSLH